MRVAICDDEQEFLTKLKMMIQNLFPEPEKLFIDEYNSGEYFLLQFKAKKYDVIILDIEMGKVTGLDIAKKIRELDKNVIIAFLTSHHEFATDGYEVDAFRYMLKEQSENMFIKQFNSIFEQYYQTHISFPVKTNNVIYNVYIRDIIYFEIIKRTVTLHTERNEYQYNGKLSEIEKNEIFVNFVKPHRSYYVNLEYVSNIESSTIVLDNGDRIPLSRNLKQVVIEKYVSFLSARC